MPAPLNRLIHAVLRVFFYLLYHPFAWTYDTVAAAVSWGQWRSWVNTALPELSGPRVLELGFGPGHLQVAMHEAGLQQIGLDASPQMTRQALRRMRRAGATPRLARGDGRSLPFVSNGFDQVVATFPTEYIFQPQTLAEIWRVLHPGGSLILVPAAWISGNSPPYRFLAWLYRITGQSPASRPETINSIRLKRFTAPFEKVGFRAEARLQALPKATVLIIKAEKV